MTKDTIRELETSELKFVSGGGASWRRDDFYKKANAILQRRGGGAATRFVLGSVWHGLTGLIGGKPDDSGSGGAAGVRG